MEAGIILSLWSALLATTFPLAVCSLLAASIGCTISLGAHYRLLPRKLTSVIALTLLAFLFYPKVILFATLSLLLSDTSSLQFSRSAWGFALCNLPAAIGLAYLIFSTVLQVENYSQVSINYIQNARRTRLPTLIGIGAVPFQHWFATAVLISFSVMAFQAAMIGRSGPVTVGRYLSQTLGDNRLGFEARLAVALLALGILIIFILFIPWLWRVLWTKCARLTLLLTGLPHGRSRTGSSKRLLRTVGSLVSIIVLLLAVLLHAFVLLRLMGLLSEPFEQTLPRLNLALILQAFAGAFDAGVAGAIAATAMICVAWFMLLPRSLSNKMGRVIPLAMGVIAFVPSSFLGALLLEFPIPNTILLLLWGFITGGALVALLASGQILGRKIYRYDNLRRVRGLSMSVVYFVREYWQFLVGLFFLASLFNAFDAGFREQLGDNGLASSFGARLGEWSPDVRGLALLICAVLILVMLLLERGVSPSRAEESPAG